MKVADPRLLIVETSGRTGLVAVAQGPALLAVRALDEARRHARDLAPAVVELCRAQGWKLRDLHGVIVSRGPGSYTGLRVGIMSAKTLAFACGCALLAIDTFPAIALQAPAEATLLDVTADAQQNKVYVQRFVRPTSGSSIQPGDALAIRPVAEWVKDLPEGAWVSGPGLRGQVDKLPAHVCLVDAACWDPTPECLLRLGLARWLAGEKDDFWTVEPLYLRPSAAEEQWQARAEQKRPDSGR